MSDRRDARLLPRWTESLLTPEQRRVLRVRFGLLEDDDDGAIPEPASRSDGGRGGGSPAPTSPSAPAYLTRPVNGRR